MIDFKPFCRNPAAPRIYVTETGRMADIGRGIIELTLIVPKRRGRLFIFNEAVTIAIPYAALLESHQVYEWTLESLKQRAH